MRYYTPACYAMKKRTLQH